MTPGKHRLSARLIRPLWRGLSSLAGNAENTHEQKMNHPVLFVSLIALGMLAAMPASRSHAAAPLEAAVAPTTQPTSQPAEPAPLVTFEETQEYTVLKAASDLAKARLNAIVEDRTKSLVASQDYQTALKNVQDAEAKLNTVRATGSPEERLAASAALVKAKSAVDMIRSNVINQDPDYRAAVAASRKAETELKDAKTTHDRQRLLQEKAIAAAKAKAAALAAAKDPVRRGLIEGRVAVGMTAAQVRNLYGDGSLLSDTIRGRQMDYVVREPNYVYHVHVTFVDDKVTSWSSRATNYPTLRYVGDMPKLTKGMTIDQLQSFLGSNGKAVGEQRLVGSAADLLAAPPPAGGPNATGNVPHTPRVRPAAEPEQTFLQTTYCWRVIIETRNGIYHHVLSVKLADLQVYDYRLGTTANNN